jgi:hypothetical protein
MMNARVLPIIEFTLDVPPRKIEVEQRSLAVFSNGETMEITPGTYEAQAFGVLYRYGPKEPRIFRSALSIRIQNYIDETRRCCLEAAARAANPDRLRAGVK